MEPHLPAEVQDLLDRGLKFTSVADDDDVRKNTRAEIAQWLDDMQAIDVATQLRVLALLRSSGTLMTNLDPIRDAALAQVQVQQAERLAAASQDHSASLARSTAWLTGTGLVVAVVGVGVGLVGVLVMLGQLVLAGLQVAQALGWFG